MKYKITGNVDISGKTLGATIEAEPHAMTEYLKAGNVEEVIEAEITVELSERDIIKQELTEKGIEFKGNAKTEALKELNV